MKVSLLLICAAIIAAVIGFKVVNTDAVGDNLTKLSAANKQRGSVFADGDQLAQGLTTQRFKYVKPNKYDVPENHANYQIGAKFAPLQLVIFTDPACGSCQYQINTVLETMKDFGKNLRVVYKYKAHNPDILDGGLFAQYMRKKGMHKQFWDNLPTNVSTLSTADFVSYLEGMNIPLDEVRAAMVTEAERSLNHLLQDQADARHLGVQEIPTYFFNGYRVDNKLVKLEKLPDYSRNILQGRPIWGSEKGVQIPLN